MGSAYALGAGTIVNAIAGGRGAAFGLDIKVTARVILNESGNIRGRITDNPVESTKLIEKCVENTLSYFGAKYGAYVETDSKVPIARGLSSSSAAANAVILATASALDEKIESMEAIKIGVKTAKEVGVTITGAFDDACASFLGGIVVTDNINNKLLLREESEDYAVILVPEEKKYTKESNIRRMKIFRSQVEKVHDMALEGKFYDAMTLNGLIYCTALGFDSSIILKALESGAKSASLSGKGPSFVALADKEDVIRIEKAWKSIGNVLVSKINNEGSGILNEED